VLGPLVVDIEGPRLTARERRRLRHPLVGQVILFARNYESARQLARLTAAIHALRDPPLLICVDHEGGRVQRFRQGFTPIGPMARLGRHWDRDAPGACRAAVSTGFVIGSELRSRGVDLSFTPVLDLDWARSGVIGDRALHADPRVVTLLASHLAQGLALAGMACCGKHFPGHGWTAADSHHAIPVDPRPLKRILEHDAAPYRWIGVGLSAVMPAHVVYPKVDLQPAGFSSRWIERILRGRLGFAGAVYSDDLSMEGAREAGDMVDRARAALGAGCDFVLICNNPEAADRVIARLAWRRSRLFDQRLARLRPRGEAPVPARLARDPLYQAALRDLA
jgi:beta-N-acetylhexosaminidase